MTSPLIRALQKSKVRKEHAAEARQDLQKERSTKVILLQMAVVPSSPERRVLSFQLQ